MSSSTVEKSSASFGSYLKSCKVGKKERRGKREADEVMEDIMLKTKQLRFIPAPQDVLRQEAISLTQAEDRLCVMEVEFGGLREEPGYSSSNRRRSEVR